MFIVSTTWVVVYLLYLLSDLMSAGLFAGGIILLEVASQQNDLPQGCKFESQAVTLLYLLSLSDNFFYCCLITNYNFVFSKSNFMFWIYTLKLSIYAPFNMKLREG